MRHLFVIAVFVSGFAAACSSSGTGTSKDSGILFSNLPDGGGLVTAGNGAAGTVAGFGVGNAGSGTGGAGGAGGTGALVDGGGLDASTDLDAGTDAAVGNDAAAPDVDASAELDAGADAAVAEDAAVTGDADAGTDAAVGTDPWPPLPATDELQALPDNYATAICTALSSCLLPTYYEFAYDGDGCKDRVKAQLEDGELVYLQASIDAERVSFSTAALDQCYSEVAALGCDVFTARSPAHCTAAVQGLVPKGEPCVIDSECMSGMFCDRGAGCPGACADERAANGACDRSEQCAGGLLCAGSKCRAPAITGEACEQAGAPPCALGNLCVGADPDKGTAGTCVDQQTAFSLNADQECDPSVGDWCKDGLACVVDKKPGGAATDLIAVCKARVGVGAACNFSFAPEQCQPSQYCPADLNPSYTDTCVDRPGEGQACGLYGVCGQGLRCKGEKCVPPARIGDACGVANDCASGRCRSGKCAAPARCRLDAAPPVCGDDSCDVETEDCGSCPQDCGACPAVCGNAKCESGEDCETCSADCGACPDICGDDSCDASETCQSCSADCGACPAPYSACSKDSECGPGKTCVKKSVPSLPLFPPTTYGYCAEACATSATCSGNATQRQCTVNGCALRCDTILGVLDPTQRCPDLGMQCISNVCTWQY